ncbi:hypothetical protein B7494_g5092 [Chlorociboria aeruginascens]|nr:hypothetical protein B7494_g5092 [Chlorociboria aeruginascens]
MTTQTTQAERGTPDTELQNFSPSNDTFSHRLRITNPENVEEEAVTPANVVDALQKWNSPVVLFIFIGLGNGLIDAAWCAWIGNMANSNEVSGFLQACYALGATIAPLITTAMISKGGLEWYAFYYLMVGISAIEFLTSAYTFWYQTGAIYQAENPRDPNSTTGRTRQALKSKVTWIFALFIFGYVGAEVSLGGWIVVFMTRVRKATSFAGGATAAGFWGGMTLGRLCLSFLTARLGEFESVLLYLILTIILQLVFWLVPNLAVSAVSVAFLGVFMGPMFPTAIVLITKLLPRSLHVGTIGFATAFGGSGGAIFPFAVGAIAQAKGVKALQPVILSLLTILAILWFCLPRRAKKDSRLYDRENAAGPNLMPAENIH